MTKKFVLVLSVLFLSLSIVAQPNSPFDILITEVMYDPSPAIHLPENEFVEFYNRTSGNISLKNWIWQVGDRSVVLPDVEINANEFLVMIPKSAEFLENVRVFSPETWITLSNSGQYICLKNPDGDIIHFMSYSGALFENPLQREGGWSLNLTCQDFPCCESSWQVTGNASGGSPGSPEFSDCELPASTETTAVRSGYLSDNQGLIYISNRLVPNRNNSGISIRSDEGVSLSWNFFEDKTDILMFDAGSLNPNSIALLSVFGDAVSCNGSALKQSEVKWGRPNPALAGDLVISEIMFNPDENGIEYVELFNLSEKVIDVSDLILSTTDFQGMIKDFSRRGDLPFLLFPGEYCVLAADRTWLELCYPQSPKGSCHERKDIPGLVNSGGGILLSNQFQAIIDRVFYNPDWHFKGLPDDQAVSLERINLKKSGEIRENWFSASSSAGFASPGLENSQNINNSGEYLNSIQLINPVFGPRDISLPDQAVVSLQFDEIGYSGNLDVADLSGRIVRIIHPWGLLPKDGQLIWDGTDDLGRFLKDGIYILILNYANMSGQHFRWKSAVQFYNY